MIKLESLLLLILLPRQPVKCRYTRLDVFIQEIVITSSRKKQSILSVKWFIQEPLEQRSKNLRDFGDSVRKIMQSYDLPKILKITYIIKIYHTYFWQPLVRYHRRITRYSTVPCAVTLDLNSESSNSLSTLSLF